MSNQGFVGVLSIFLFLLIMFIPIIRSSPYGFSNVVSKFSPLEVFNAFYFKKYFDEAEQYLDSLGACDENKCGEFWLELTIAKPEEKQHRSL